MKRTPKDPETSRPKRRVRFFPHQLTEYAIGAALVAVGLQLTKGIRWEFETLGALLLVLNLFTKGRLSAVKYIGRHVHHVLDLVIVVFAAASPFFGFIRHDVRAIISTECVALLLLFVEQSTTYKDLPLPQRTLRFPRPAPKTAAQTSSTPAPQRTVTIQPSVNVTARQLGVATGVAKRMIKNRRNARRSGN